MVRTEHNKRKDRGRTGALRSARWLCGASRPCMAHHASAAHRILVPRQVCRKYMRAQCQCCGACDDTGLLLCTQEPSRIMASIPCAMTLTMRMQQAGHGHTTSGAIGSQRAHFRHRRLQSGTLAAMPIAQAYQQPTKRWSGIGVNFGAHGASAAARAIPNRLRVTDFMTHWGLRRSAHRYFEDVAPFELRPPPGPFLGASVRAGVGAPAAGTSPPAKPPRHARQMSGAQGIEMGICQGTRGSERCKTQGCA